MKRKNWILPLMILLAVFILVQACHSDNSKRQQKYDVAAFFWPDYHYEPRLEFIFTDKKGEWQTIYDAKPKDSMERQPRIPLWGYQDGADPKVMDQKIQAAVTHGVNVFIFDWYWYDNKPLLESALDSGFLKANHDRMKFYIMWANHDATSYWDPKDSIKDQVYWTGRVGTAVFHTIVSRMIDKYFKQSSYYKIDGKPVFSLYELNNFIKGLGGPKAAKQALDYFREKTKEAGFPGLYLQAVLWGAIPEELEGVNGIHSQDSVMQYFGFNSFTNYTWAHLQNAVGDYDKWADAATSFWKKYSDYSIPYFPQVSVGWDNNPRFPPDIKTGYITNPTPAKFKKYLMKAKKYLDDHPDQPKLITINAWNEWSEGSYLEPDTLYKMQYLDALKEVFGRSDNNARSSK